VRNRWIVVALALLGGSAFALSVQVGMWWSVGEVSIGPFGARHCFGGECRRSGLGFLEGGDLWMRSGTATGAGGLIAMFALLVLAARVASNRIPKLAAKASLVAIATATACGGYFLFEFPGLGGASIDHGVYLFAIAIVLGVAAATSVLLSARRSG
jgi:hypothetical protein